MIESLEHETEKARAVREMEERLISSAFYNLSMQMHRTAVENRLSNVHSSSSTHGQSFLARQRQQQQHAQQSEKRMWAKHLVSQIHYGLGLMTIDSDYTHSGLLRSRGIGETSLGLILLREFTSFDS